MQTHAAEQTLVFTIAMNGYQWLYKDFIDSHRNYAEKRGYRHLCVSYPAYTLLGVECCWLKLAIIVQALKSGYDQVLFVDADAHIKEGAPAIEQAALPNKHMYLAQGYSGQFNSGVIYVRANQQVLEWLEMVIANRQQCNLEEDMVGWGENGHIIHHARQTDFIATLDPRWNNTFDPQLDDYIRHYNHGPMRVDYRLKLIHKTLNRISRLIAKLSPGKTHTGLGELTQVVTRHYANWFTPCHFDFGKN